MVQLKQFRLNSGRQLYIDFNSIMVQLKPGDNSMKTFMYVFQFHNGTIKTRYSLQSHS